MSRIVIYPYKLASASSKQIAEALRNTHGRKTIRVYPDRKYRPSGDDIIINWGNAHRPEWKYANILNKPEAVALAVNKLVTFKKLEEQGVRTVPFTTDREVANEWRTIFERHALNGHSGAGIKVTTRGNVGVAPLYTKGLLPCEEYRVHVFKGEVIDYSKKVKHEGGDLIESNDELVKNKAAGWEFLRDVKQREGVCKRALEAVAALGLDFGSVDVIRHDNKSYVLEVGTAAGLSPRGVEIYAAKINSYAK